MMDADIIVALFLLMVISSRSTAKSVIYPLEDEKTQVIKSGLPEPYTLSELISTKQLPPPLESITTCHPTPTTGLPQYLIGYGSLMQKASKERTDPKAGESIPARVYGYNRVWDCKGGDVGYSTTYLGAQRSSNDSAFFNTVIYKVPSLAGLLEYDRREEYYCRREVLSSSIQILSSKPAHQRLPTGQYWIYLTKPEQAVPPSDKYPMVQSYVDTFLSGCFEQEDNFNMPGFAEECIDTTLNWNEHWVNDRLLPRRPFFYQPAAGRIDKLLNEKLTDIFTQIRIE